MESGLVFSEESTYRSHGFTGLKKSYVRFRRLFVNLLITENYEQLSKELTLHTPQDIKAFFLEEGQFLLVQAIAAGNIQPLNFIIANIPFEAVKDVFNKGLPKILKNFLYAQKRREERGESSPEWHYLMMEKFKLFLKISSGEVQKFMGEHMAMPISDYITTSIKTDYEMALQSYNAIPKTSVIPPTP